MLERVDSFPITLIGTFVLPINWFLGSVTITLSLLTHAKENNNPITLALAPFSFLVGSWVIPALWVKTIFDFSKASDEKAEGLNSKK